MLDACELHGLRQLLRLASCAAPQDQAYSPPTNRKAERFIQTLLRGCAYAMPFISSTQRVTALRGWLRHYNEDRLRGTIRMTPFLKAAA